MLRLEQPDMRIDVSDVPFGHFFCHSGKVFMRVCLKTAVQRDYASAAYAAYDVIGVCIDGTSVFSIDTDIISYGHDGRKVLDMGHVVED